ncbi:hypothetical protein PI125_g3150 [Phytophthora idaei]|nr:hypothetical protein PI125_g3150 [Phytophthora idaei]KAG3171513.1 hypothetical protein PI126_g1846 [Phytophthora idaei]
MVSAFITTIKVLTTIAQIAQRLSPVPDLYRVHKQDTGVMAFMPLVTLLLCNHVWLIYAYIVSNISRSSRSVSLVTSSWLSTSQSTPSTALTEPIHQSRDQLGDVFGYLANVTTFALFLSPFEKIKVVIETKSSAAIPVLLCGIIFVNSSLWLVNGIVDDDLFIVVPNVVGVTLTAVQLTLYYIYRR